MCNIPVTLPTVASFLMLYSLRCGCMVILAWTMVRSLFYIVFLMVTIILMYMPNSEHTKSQPTHDSFYFVFPSYIILIVTECFVFMFAIYLGVGIYSESTFRVQQYLICRFCAFLLEALALVFLCFNHQYYIGWYLVFLIIIILELYSFIVVYSYYVETTEDQEAKECEDNELNFESELNDSMADTRDTQDTQCMRASRHTRALRCTPEPLDMRSLRCTPEPRDTRGSRYTPEPRVPRCTPEPRAPQCAPEPRDMRASRYTLEPQGPRCTPEPQDTRAPRCTPEPRHMRASPDTRTTGDTREMRNMKNVRDIMPDFRDPGCTRKTHDHKRCLGHKTATYLD